MSIGIMDADLSTYLLVPFNLECMKLSAYYKKKNQIVIFTNQFYPERHQKFIYRKDYEDGIYPQKLLQTANVEYGGLAFSNNQYKSLPLEIEKMKPDTSLYAKMGVMIKGDARRDKIFNNMMTAEHCRLSLDDKTIWPDYGRQFTNLYQARNLMLHDHNLGGIQGAYETVKDILKHARNDGWATRLGMKFPVQVSDGQSLLNWSSFNTNSTFYGLQYNGIIDDDAFQEWVGVCRERAVFSQMEYHVTDARYDENHFLNDLLPKIFQQVIISRSYHIFFSLKYDKGFFTDPQWERVIKLINFFHNSYSSQPIARYAKMISDDTLFDFAAACQKRPRSWYGEEAMTQDEIREIFAFVREYNYPLFKMFYECSAQSLGG